jgi:hypothetical protein
MTTPDKVRQQIAEENRLHASCNMALSIANSKGDSLLANVRKAIRDMKAHQVDRKHPLWPALSDLNRAVKEYKS